MLDRTGHFPQPPGNIEQVHLIVLLADFVRHTARPSLNLVESVLLFVVPRLANVDVFVLGEATRPTLVETSYEHDETSIYDFVDTMVAILACLDHFVFEEVLLKPMDSLLRSIVPAGVHPLLTGLVLPGSVNLGDNRFRQIVRVGDMDPIT